MQKIIRQDKMNFLAEMANDAQFQVAAFKQVNILMLVR